MTRTSVNRYLKDKAMDRIDHALGRPVNPMRESYRNYFCTDICNPQADEMAASPCWQIGRKLDGGAVYFHVTTHGRKMLSKHLKEIGDKNRTFIVSWGGYEMEQIAETHSKARYLRWLAISDTSDVTFRQFQAQSKVRLSA